MSIEDIAELEPDPLEIDSRHCGECGLRIDQHRRVDTPEGPEFFCEDDLEIQIHLAAADLVKQWELADPRDRWRHTGEPPPKASDISNARREPYCTPPSVVDAFLYVVRLGDADYLSRWLAQHPLDAPYLLKIWDRKNALA